MNNMNSKYLAFIRYILVGLFLLCLGLNRHVYASDSLAKELKLANELDVQAIKKRLHKLNDKRYALSDLTGFQEIYMSEWLPFLLLREASSSAGLSEKDEKTAHMFGKNSAMPVSAAEVCLLKLAMFEALSRQEPKSALDYLLSTADSPASVSDVCLAGIIIWGDKFQAPTSTGKDAWMPDLDDIVLNNPIISDLPIPRNEIIEKLCTAENLVIRWLAFMWIRDKDSSYRDTDRLWRIAMKDESIAIRTEWYNHVSLLNSSDAHVQYEAYIKWAKPRINGLDEKNNKIEKELYDDVLRQLSGMKSETDKH